MTFKANEAREEEAAPMIPIPPPPGKNFKKPEEKKVGPVDNNLYSLHDFEIDLHVPLPSKYFVLLLQL